MRMRLHLTDLIGEECVVEIPLLLKGLVPHIDIF